MKTSRITWLLITIAAFGTAMLTYSYVRGKASNHSVTLRWSPSPNATAYNVYRGTNSGGPYTPVGSTATASYTDSSVSSGTTYYYVVTTVQNSRESAYSVEIHASIP